MAKLLGRSVVLWIALVDAILNLIVVFEMVDWSDAQIAGVNLVALAAIALATGREVTNGKGAGST